MQHDDLAKRAKRARREAENAAATELIDWHRSEKARIEADLDLSISEREYALRELMFEFGQRSKRALRKAKRENSAPKLLEREVRAELEAKRADGRPDASAR